MPEKRYFEVKTDTAGVIGTSYLMAHSPKDFFGDVLYIAPAKPGKVYATRNGATLSYRRITRDEYAAKIAERDALPPAVIEQPSAVEDEYHAHPPILVRRVTCGDEVSYTGETLHDDDHISALGFNMYFDRSALVVLRARAAEIGLSVEVTNDDVSSDGDVIDLPDGASVRIESPGVTVALYSAPPPMSKRQRRRKSGALFGAVRRG